MRFRMLRSVLVGGVAVALTLTGWQVIADHNHRGDRGKGSLGQLNEALKNNQDKTFDETIDTGNPTGHAYVAKAHRGAGFFSVDELCEDAGEDSYVNPAYENKTHGELEVRASVRGNCLQQLPGGYFKLYFSPDNLCGGARYWRIPNACFVSATKIGQCPDGCWIWDVRIRC